ncbi:hypothetical protein EOM86_04975 [Candidatus Nomurabacteria bacterium]|nr:hypothetical protein [Candidatus Nomurabacteria bacterium]
MRHGDIPNQTILAIDGKAVAYICFFSALKEYGEGNTENIRLGTIYNFLSRIQGIAVRFKSNRLIFCWDSKSSVRIKICPEYKSDRYESEDKDAIQHVFTELEQKVLPSIGFNNNIRWEGFEADDILAVLAKGVKPTTPLVLVTTDRDLLQCLKSNVVFHNPKRYNGFCETATTFRNEYGIEPHQWADVKALCGCQTDKVSGVPGVGPVKALQYVKGELKRHHKAFFNIVENPALIQRNRILTTLPHPEAPKSVKLVSNSLSKEKIIQMADDYGFDTFKEELMPTWEKIIYGNY